MTETNKAIIAASITGIILGMVIWNPELGLLTILGALIFIALFALIFFILDNMF